MSDYQEGPEIDDYQERPYTPLQRLDEVRGRLEARNREDSGNPFRLCCLGRVYSMTLEERARIFDVLQEAGIIHDEEQFWTEQDELSRKSREAYTQATKIFAQAFRSELGDRLGVEIYVRRDDGSR